MVRWIRLTHGLEALVDDGDYTALSKHRWRAVIGRDGMPYAVRVVRRGDEQRESRQMQRVIMDPRGERPRRMRVESRNGNTLDNRRQNLRWLLDADRSSVRRLPKTNRTGFLGVHLAASGVYRVQLQVGGRRWSGGTYLDPVEAARAYNAMALRYIGPTATLNAVPPPAFNQAIYDGGPRTRRSPSSAQRTTKVPASDGSAHARAAANAHCARRSAARDV